MDPQWCRYSSVDSSAPSIMLPRVQVPSTPSLLLSVCIVQIVYLSFELECDKNQSKQKEAGIAHFKKLRIHNVWRKQFYATDPQMFSVISQQHTLRLSQPKPLLTQSPAFV